MRPQAPRPHEQLAKAHKDVRREQNINDLARVISQGADHFSTAAIMPKEGESTAGHDVGDHLERVEGVTKDGHPVGNEPPSWTKDHHPLDALPHTPVATDLRIGAGDSRVGLRDRRHEPFSRCDIPTRNPSPPARP